LSRRSSIGKEAEKPVKPKNILGESIEAEKEKGYKVKPLAKNRDKE